MEEKDLDTVTTICGGTVGSRTLRNAIFHIASVRVTYFEIILTAVRASVGVIMAIRPPTELLDSIGGRCYVAISVKRVLG